MKKQLDSLANGYLHCQNNIKTLEKTLVFQKRIQKYHTIPKKFLPRHLSIAQPNNGNLQRSFDEQYKKLFFNHLNETIKINNLSLELKKTKLASFLDKFTTLLTETPLTGTHLHDLYDCFLKKIKLDNFRPPPSLQLKLQSKAGNCSSNVTQQPQSTNEETTLCQELPTCNMSESPQRNIKRKRKNPSQAGIPAKKTKKSKTSNRSNSHKKQSTITPFLKLRLEQTETIT